MTSKGKCQINSEKSVCSERGVFVDVDVVDVVAVDVVVGCEEGGGKPEQTQSICTLNRKTDTHTAHTHPHTQHTHNASAK